MKRHVVVLLGAASWVWPQPAAPPARDAQRAAYQSWRETDAALEKEAGEISQLPQRVGRSLEAAAKYAEARAAYVRSLTEESAEFLLWIQNSGAVELDLAPSAVLQSLVNLSTGSVERDIANYTGDSDRGIQQLRQALERERAALTALSTAIASRQKANDKAAQTLAATDGVRARALEQYQAFARGVAAQAAQAGRESSAWAAYYQALSDAPKLAESGPAALAARIAELSPGEPAARAPEPAVGGAAAPPEAPTPVIIGGVRINNPVRPAGPTPEPTSAAGGRAPDSAPGNPPRTGAVPPLPLARYTGAWTFPPAAGLFHGLEPESVDLVVREENGSVTGSLFGRFKLPAGSSDQPVLRFDFSGELKSTRNQLFGLQTSEGAKGNIELIPGGAFNLLEVNFVTEPKPGSIRVGNFVLIKK